MRIFLRFLLPFVLIAGPAFAQMEDGEEDAPAAPIEAPDDIAPDAESGEASLSRLDTLFADLKRERNVAAAERISRQIWAEWLKSGSASVDLMMQWSNDAAKKKDYDVALDFLDQVIMLEPGFAEAWNRRATVHFMMDDYPKSMSDINRTLALEPRHFGALSGMAAILKNTGRKQLALDAYERTLAIYPMMRSAQEEVSKLAEELAGEGI